MSNSVSTMFVYDKAGTIVASFMADGMTPPVGIPYTIIDVPEGKIVESIDPASGKAVWADDHNTLTKIDELVTKIDYITMMTGIDMSVFDSMASL